MRAVGQTLSLGCATPSAWRRGRVAWALGMASLLLLPHLLSGNHGGATPVPGLPRVHSGDEPHYLVMVSSLLRDGDLDLANNYRSVHEGGDDAGENFRGAPLDHHTSWWIQGRFVRWNDLYKTQPKFWTRDARGVPVPKRRPGSWPVRPPAVERSYHGAGLALLLATLLFPFRHTPWIEPLALGCSWLAVLAGLWGFLSLARRYSPDGRVPWLAASLAFLGSPAWHYGRSLFTEPYLLGCALAGYALFFGRRSVLWSAPVIALGIVIKPQFALIGLPLGLFLLLRRRWRDALLFALPCSAGVAFVLWLNARYFGSIFHFPMTWETGNPLRGGVGLLFSLSHGLLACCPLVLCALAGWPELLRRRGAEALVIAAGVLGQFLLIASYLPWHAGYCYGPRYLVPILPLLLLGLVPRLAAVPAAKRDRFELAVICGLSVGIGYLAAVPYWKSFSAHPLAELFP